MVEENDLFFNLLPFFKVTVGKNIMRCQRLVSASLLKSTGIKNNPHYLNLGFQIKSYELLNELNSTGENYFYFFSDPKSILNSS